MIEGLYTFPIVMVDGRDEQKRNMLGIDTDEDIDYIEGEASVPYADFVGVVDRWLPDRDSLERARHGQFDACYVIFAVSGTFVCTWPKKKFLAGIQAYAEEQNKPSKIKEIRIMNKEQLKKFADEMPDDEPDKNQQNEE